MERKSALRMFLLPFVSFCASACFQISGLIKNLNDNHHEDGNGDSVKVFCIVGVSLTSFRLGYCIASGCWDNPNYQGNPTYWMTEYVSIILNALTNVFNSDIFQIIAFISGVISIAWNLVHACSKDSCLNLWLKVLYIIYQLIYLISFIMMLSALLVVFFGCAFSVWTRIKQLHALLIFCGFFIFFSLLELGKNLVIETTKNYRRIFYLVWCISFSFISSMLSFGWLLAGWNLVKQLQTACILAADCMILAYFISKNFEICRRKQEYQEIEQIVQPFNFFMSPIIKLR